jgi:DNA-binding protein HU-alpha
MADEADGADGAKGLTKRKLLDLVAAETGGKRAKMRGVVDATLRQVGDALSRGESLSLPPLGRINVARTNEKGGAILRFRRAAGGKGKDGAEGVAQGDEAE